ncbi:DUF1801 domain-containing protein [Cohnella nanjingensis]|uniref:DUF1801 domain-containing protein n=1 Tax=Cohnella nanjingensis TaxID=1387779 RepID=A0A7X0VIM3_9BACL|nr:DUF1801 domain-containing protein [Cohnella nanjingensis]MBB6673809.1 DUF1801 domain-containing protein [Cohnella nanjingensis]
MTDNNLNQGVTDYIQKIEQEWQKEIVQLIRKAIHKAIPDVNEQIKMTTPNYTKNGKVVCTLFAAKTWVTLTIFNTGELEIPQSLHNVSDYPDRVQLKIKKGHALDEQALTEFMQQAAATIAV